MKLRNVNPIGQVDLPLIYRQGEPFGQEGAGCLEPGEVFEATVEQARQLLMQPHNYKPADTEATQLQGELDAAELDGDGGLGSEPDDDGTDNGQQNVGEGEI